MGKVKRPKKQKGPTDVIDTKKQQKKDALDIDEIFSKKDPNPIAAVPSPSTSKKPKSKAAALPFDDFADSRGLNRKSRPTTEEGYPVYQIEEMKIGLGGGTPDCPFDCNCCF